MNYSLQQLLIQTYSEIKLFQMKINCSLIQTTKRTGFHLQLFFFPLKLFDASISLELFVCTSISTCIYTGVSVCGQRLRQRTGVHLPRHTLHVMPRYGDILSFCLNNETAVLSVYQDPSYCPYTVTGRKSQSVHIPRPQYMDVIVYIDFLENHLI